MIRISEFKKWQQWYGEQKIRIDEVQSEVEILPNEGVILEGDGATQYCIAKCEYLVPIKDYQPCKIIPKNQEQKLALHILKDETIPLKILSGVAGSGKTLLACAHALHQLRRGTKTKIIIAKSMTPVGREIGYLKGGMEDKVRPWLGPFYDNFIQCGVPDYEIDEMMREGVLEITPITFIQGRSIANAIIIIDECQNLDMDVLKQIITRAAHGSELILLGDQTQVFEYRVKNRSIDILAEKGKTSELVAYIYLSRSLRSAIADWAVDNL